MATNQPSSDKNPEVWLRGPVQDVPGLMQPIAHALLQAKEDVGRLMAGFPDAYLWERPAGLASVGFHLQHLRGVIDRLFTYARAETLSQRQLVELSQEGKEDPGINCSLLVEKFNRQVDRAILQLSNTPETLLLEKRGVGRLQIPSTVNGLITHAAEHTQRHFGQLLVTARFLLYNHQP